MRASPPIIAILLCATAALAHSDVKSPQVLARMHGMEAIAEATKTVGLMVKGETPFDIVAARAALAQIARHAADIPAQFRDRADDPKSEARETIWTNWDHFVAEAEALAAIAVSAEVREKDHLRAIVEQISATCRSCHSAYRE